MLMASPLIQPHLGETSRWVPTPGSFHTETSLFKHVLCPESGCHQALMFPCSCALENCGSSNQQDTTQHLEDRNWCPNCRPFCETFCRLLKRSLKNQAPTAHSSNLQIIFLYWSFLLPSSALPQILILGLWEHFGLKNCSQGNPSPDVCSGNQYILLSAQRGVMWKHRVRDNPPN